MKKVKFLGSNITQKGNRCADIKSKIGQAKTVPNRMAEIMQPGELSTRLKVRLDRAMVWSVALYEYETWTISTQNQTQNIFSAN